MQNISKENDTTRDLEEARRQSLMNSFGKRVKSKDKPVEEEQDVEENVSQVEENQENDEKKLDIDEKNSYINDESNESSSEEDENISKYKEIFEKQFGADGVKAVKTWSQTQSEYMKLRNELKDRDGKLNTLDKLLQENPKLAEALEKAYRGEDVGSLEELEQEPKGKPNTSVQKSKPDTTQNVATTIDEQKLIESGYLDTKQKQFLDDTQWNTLVRQASMEYMMSELPKVIAQRSLEETRKQTEEEKRREQAEQVRQRNHQLNIERYNKGIDKVAIDYGLDFVNNKDHKAILDEIDGIVVGLVDKDNKGVIREDAVEIAAKYLIDKQGLTKQQKETTKEQIEQSTFEGPGLNVNTRSQASSREQKPKTIAEKLRQRRVDEYNRQLQNREIGG